MNTSSNKVRVRKVPHWKSGAPLKSFKFSLTAEQRKTMKLSSMKMGGFKHKFQRDVETNITEIFGKNEKLILSDLKKLFPEVDVKVARVFIPFGDY